MTIHFDGKEIEYHFNFRADMLFENIMEKSFSGQTETEWLVFWYCNYLSLTNDYELSLDDFISKLDQDPISLYEFIGFYSKVMTNQMNLIPKDKEQDSKKKVKKQTKSKK